MFCLTVVQSVLSVLAIEIPNSLTNSTRYRTGANDLPTDDTADAVVEEGLPLASPFVGYWPLGCQYQQKSTR